jgi:hypothetical protein
MEDAYVNYSDYSSDFKGILIPGDLFNSYVKRASSKVDYFTFYRISDDTFQVKYYKEKVIFATCEIAELLYNQDQLIDKLNDDKSTIASETVGPHSKSFVNKSSLQVQRILSSKELEQECYKICLRYLASTGLMYRGI